MSDQGYEELFKRQLELEAEMQGMGITRFREQLAKARDRKEETTVSHGSQLLRAAIDPCSSGIRSFVEGTKSGKAGRRHSSAKYLEQMNYDVSALIIAKVILDQITFRNPVQRAALRIGQQLEEQVRFTMFEEKAKGLWIKLKQQTKDSTMSHKERVLIYTMNKVGIHWTDWGKKDKLHLGMKAIEIFCETTGLAMMERRYEGKNKSIIYIEATQTTMDWITEKNARSEILFPVYLPTIVPPKEWTTPYNGGYHSDAIRRQSFVKTRNKNTLEELNNKKDEMSNAYDAINALQNVGWKINSPVLEVAKSVWEAGQTWGDIPPREDIEVPRCPLGEGVKGKDLEGEEKEQFISWKKTATAIHDRNSRLRSKRLQIAKVITIAERFQPEDALYFPHTYDFRGRVYATPMFLNPQGADLAKGLLTFSEGKPLGTEKAAEWLAIQGANVFGYDKASLSDRVLWAHLNSEKIRLTVEAPLDMLWWTEADKPWQFLAWCYEWVGYMNEGLNYVSSLPIALDGSCNGIQHYSAMLRDEVGGKSVNLMPSETPEDIYKDVADLTVAKLRLDDSTMATKWLDWGITRKDSKRSVMVLPYGGTLFSCRSFIQDTMQDRIEAGEEDVFGEESFKAAIFLAKIMWEAIGETVIAAREAMGWLQKGARLVAKEGLPIVWTTPDGFTVVQSYPEQKSRRVETQLGQQMIKLTLKEDLPTLDKSRMANAIAPNFVHALDGTALRMCVTKSVKEGVNQFAMVHDSYGTNAADTETLARCLREAFVEMYTDHDVLREFKDEITQVTDASELPELPPMGTLDLNLIMESDFFFA